MAVGSAAAQRYKRFRTAWLCTFRHALPRILIQMGCLDRDGGQMNTAATLGVASIRLSKQPILAGIKHLNRLEQCWPQRKRRQKSR